jgi:large repetitive protein
MTLNAPTTVSNSASTVTVSGTCGEGAVTVSWTGDAAGNQFCNSGTFSADINKSVDGTYIFQFIATNSELVSTAPLAFTWTRDASAPAAPTVTSPAVSPFYSSAGSVTISGGCETGATVNLAGSDTQSVVCAASAYSFTISKASDALYNFNISQTDANNNASPSTQQSWRKDTVAPAAPVITGPGVSPYTSGDSAISIVGTCELNASLEWTGASSGSAACSGGSFSIPMAQSNDGTYALNLIQKDQALNASSAAPFTWVRDTSIPPSVIIQVPLGAYSNSNLSSQVVSGTCTTGYDVALAGDILATEVSNPNQSLLQTCTGGAFSFTINKTVDGIYAFEVTQENTSNNQVSAPALVEWERDSVAPAPVVILNPASNPFRAPDPLMIDGECEDGATVLLSGDDTQSTVCAGSAFSFSVSETLDGTYSYLISQRDGANNTSSSVTVTWQRDSSAIPPPTITTPATLTYASNEASLLISGACVTGYTVKLAGDVSAPELTPGLTTVCSSSSYSFTLNKAADGVFAIAVSQIYLAQESSAVQLQWTRDTTAPSTTLTAQPANPSYQKSAAFSFSSNDPSAVYECSLNGAAYVTCVSGIAYTTLSNASHTFSVRARDNLGNVDLTPAEATWTQLAYNTLALYSMNTASPLLDESTYAMSGLVNSGATTGATGKFAQGNSFASASSQSMSASTNGALEAGQSQLTVETFVKFNSLPAKSAQQMIISKMGAAGNMGWEVTLYRQNNSYKIGFTGSVNGTTVTALRSTNCTIGTTAFHHVAVTFDKGTVKFYCDGAAKGTGTIGTAGTSNLFKSSASLRLGRSETMNATNNYLNGVLDEVRVSQSIRYTGNYTVPTAEFTAD